MFYSHKLTLTIVMMVVLFSGVAQAAAIPNPKLESKGIVLYVQVLPLPPSHLTITSSWNACCEGFMRIPVLRSSLLLKEQEWQWSGHGRYVLKLFERMVVSTYQYKLQGLNLAMMICSWMLLYVHVCRESESIDYMSNMCLWSKEFYPKRSIVLRNIASSAVTYDYPVDRNVLWQTIRA